MGLEALDFFEHHKVFIKNEADVSNTGQPGRCEGKPETSDLKQTFTLGGGD